MTDTLPASIRAPIIRCAEGRWPRRSCRLPSSWAAPIPGSRPSFSSIKELGDIFTVRVAGNIADDLAIGSMEYAVEHFATPLIVVLGHERCGAVSAAVAAVASGTMPPPHIASLVTALRPAVEASKGLPGDPVENAITMHVRLTVAALKASGPVLADAVAHGRLAIAGAEYHLASGRVGFLA